MKRILIIALGLIGVLAGLIVWRIQAQAAALRGPVSGSGVVESIGVDLSSRLAARVTRAAPEGTEVAQGDVIVELNCDEPRAILAEVEAQLVVARAQAVGAKSAAQAADRQGSAATANTRAVRAQVGALESRRDAARREAARVGRLGDLVASERHDKAQDTVIALEREVGSASASRVASRQQASAAQAQAQSAAENAQAVQDAIAVVEARLARAKLTVEECTIVAPEAGIVERTYFEPGELVSFGARVARIIRPQTIRATFYVPNAELGQVRVGQPVVVVADAFEGREFEGTVYRVGLEAEFTPRNVQTRSDRDRLVFPAEVDVVNDGGLLRAGMPITITVEGGP